MEIPGIKIFLFGQLGSEKIEVYKSQISVLTTDRENYKYKKICAGFRYIFSDLWQSDIDMRSLLLCLLLVCVHVQGMLQ